MITKTDLFTIICPTCGYIESATYLNNNHSLYILKLIRNISLLLVNNFLLTPDKSSLRLIRILSFPLLVLPI